MRRMFRDFVAVFVFLFVWDCVEVGWRVYQERRAWRLFGKWLSQR